MTSQTSHTTPLQASVSQCASLHLQGFPQIRHDTRPPANASKKIASRSLRLPMCVLRFQKPPRTRLHKLFLYIRSVLQRKENDRNKFKNSTSSQASTTPSSDQTAPSDETSCGLHHCEIWAEVLWSPAPGVLVPSLSRHTGLGGDTKQIARKASACRQREICVAY